MFDYDVGLNDIIQLMVRPLPSTEGRNGTVATTNGTVATTNGTVATTNGTETVNDGDTEDVSEGEDTVMVSCEIRKGRVGLEGGVKGRSVFSQ